MVSEPRIPEDTAEALRVIHREYGGGKIMLKAADEIKALREELNSCIYELERKGSLFIHRKRRAALARKAIKTPPTPTTSKTDDRPRPIPEL